MHENGVILGVLRMKLVRSDWLVGLVLKVLIDLGSSQFTELIKNVKSLT